MHKRTLSRFRRARISKTEDKTDTPLDLVRISPHYRKRDYAFWFGIGGAMAAVGIKAIVDLVRTVR